MAASFTGGIAVGARSTCDSAQAESEGLPGLLRWRMSQLPRSSAALFLDQGAAVDEIPALKDLDHDARANASQVSEFAGAGERALLLYPPGIDFLRAFFGCLYAGVIAVPVNLPRPGGSVTRLQGILRDAEPAVILTSSAGMGSLDYLRAQVPEFDGVPRATTDRADRFDPHFSPRPVSADSIAFLQYTSGTTSSPRGVMVSHRNVIAQIRQLELAWSVLPGDTYVTWLPLYHDMGLIGVLASLCAGARTILLSHYSFYQKPMSWLSAVSEYGARFSCAPNSAYEYCVRKISVQPAGLDLSRWELAVCGSEPVRYSTMQRFAAKFAICGFRWSVFSPSYGLAEATLAVSVSRPGVLPHAHAPARAFQPVDGSLAPPNQETTKVVNCGLPVKDVEVVIVNPASLEPCPEGEVGEIWVAGPNVAQGYWRRPEETETTFCARHAGAPGSCFLRTGDLGFLKSGNVYVSGRIKDLIIISGRNHYPHEIEETVARCDTALRPDSAAAFTVEVAGEEQLVVAQELAHPRKPDELRRIVAAIRQVVAAEHDLSIYSVRLLKPGTLPRTTSGKIQRNLCREAFLSGGLQAFDEGVE